MMISGMGFKIEAQQSGTSSIIAWIVSESLIIYHPISSSFLIIYSLDSRAVADFPESGLLARSFCFSSQ